MGAARPVRRWPRVLVLLAVGGALFAPLGIVAWPRVAGYDSGEVTGLAKAFFDALQARDDDTLAKLIHPEAIRPASDFALTKLQLHWLRAELDQPVYAGQSARVPFTVRPRLASIPVPIPEMGMMGKRGHLRLEKVPSGWVIHSLTFPVDAPEGEANLDLNRPAPTPPRPRPDLLQWFTPLTREEYDRAWQMDVQADREPAGQLFDRLTGKGKGVPLSLPDGAWRKKPCTFRLERRSRLEAIETIARQAGITLEYPLGRLQLAAIPRPLPSAFAGPFLVRVTRIEEDNAQATGTAHLQVLSRDLPAPVELLLSGWKLLAPAPDVRGPDNRDLFYARRWARRVAGPAQLSGLVASLSGGQALEVPLRGLTADIDTIHSLKGEVRVPLPVRVEKGQLRRGPNQSTARVGGVEATYKGTTLTFTGPPDRMATWQGLSVGNNPTGGSTVTCPAQVSVPGGTETIEFRIITVVVVSHHYRFDNLPLTERTPRRLEAPVFTGPAPVTLAESGRGTRSTATAYPLTVTNHCQKPVEEVRIQARHFDAGGKLLGKETVVQAAEETLIRREEQRLVGPHATHRVTARLTNQPKDTARTEFHLDEVLFCDGTTWSPPGKP